MRTTNLILILSALALGGCAAKAPPPTQNNVITIPVTLVNIDASTVGELPKAPDAATFMSIDADNEVEEALATTLIYTKQLHAYAREVTGMLIISKKENEVMRDKLGKIKNYIILSQPRVQPVQ